MDIGDYCLGVRNHRLGIRNDYLSVRNNRLGIRNNHLSIRNDDLSISDHRLNIRNHRVSADCQLGLKSGPVNSRMVGKMNGTHIEDVKDPDEVLIPSRDLVFIALREGESGERVSFPPLGDLPLDL